MADDARDKRLKAALRDNLRRRKAQNRGRADGSGSQAAEGSDPAAPAADGVAAREPRDA